MSDIHIKSLCKSFSGRSVLSDISLRISSGEFVAVLGPSGCGKTTLLRLIAGFERADVGMIKLGSRTVSSPKQHLPPEKRNLSVVFQNYALWPHMSVGENVAYSLKISGIQKSVRDIKVLEALSLVGLERHIDAHPANLSGGQRQRVALARCLATTPSVVLLDEPLANLDVHLRASMEEEFARFHTRTRASMIYITHDQSEAMALADRVVVMDAGRVIQFAPPNELYRQPATEMVAAFIGDGIILDAHNVISIGMGRAVAEVFGVHVHLRSEPMAHNRASARICIRPRNLRLASKQESGITGRVVRMIYRSGYYQADIVPDAAPNERLSIYVTDPAPITVGASVSISIDDGWIIPDPTVVQFSKDFDRKELRQEAHPKAA